MRGARHRFLSGAWRRRGRMGRPPITTAPTFLLVDTGQMIRAGPARQEIDAPFGGVSDARSRAQIGTQLRLDHARIGQLHPGILVELQLGHDLPEVFETATPRRPNAPNWHVELFGDRFVGQIVITHQQAQEALTDAGRAVRWPVGSIALARPLTGPASRDPTSSSALRYSASVTETAARRVAILRLSRRDVVANQAARRSGCSMRSMFSTRRSQVVWHTSATSASLSRHRLAIAATNP